MIKEINMYNLQIIEPDEWTVMREQADVLVHSKLLPKSVNTPEKALAIILKGRELGIPAWGALTTIRVIEGVPTVSPQLMVALIQRSGELEAMLVNGDAEQCAVTMQRKGQEPHSELFTMDDAVKQNLAKRQNWIKMPAIMLKWRAIAACARVVFPDVILGMYAPEEIAPDADVGDDGALIIETCPVVVTQSRLARTVVRSHPHGLGQGLVPPPCRRPQAPPDGGAHLATCVRSWVGHSFAWASAASSP